MSGTLLDTLGWRICQRNCICKAFCWCCRDSTWLINESRRTYTYLVVSYEDQIFVCLHLLSPMFVKTVLELVYTTFWGSLFQKPLDCWAKFCCLLVNKHTVWITLRSDLANHVDSLLAGKMIPDLGWACMSMVWKSWSNPVLPNLFQCCQNPEFLACLHNFLERVVTRSTMNTTSALNSLHWLLIQQLFSTVHSTTSALNTRHFYYFPALHHISCALPS